MQRVLAGSVTSLYSALLKSIEKITKPLIIIHPDHNEISKAVFQTRSVSVDTHARYFTGGYRVLSINRVSIEFLFSIILILCNQSLLANEPVNTDNTYLIVARTQLNIASEKYKNGEIGASSKNLKHAGEWLYKAINHSRSEEVKTEAEKLANEINTFRTVLNDSKK